MGYKILLVDDSATVRAVIAKTLRLADVDVDDLYEAGNGQEALDILEDNWIDLVFADINMPVMGGIEMLDRMKDAGMLEAVPVIMVSTEGSTSRIDQLMAQGISAYVRKPFTPELIRTVVAEIMGEDKDGQ